MSVEDILIRSSNIGTLFLAKKIGEDDYKEFIKKTKLLDVPDFELEELEDP